MLNKSKYGIHWETQAKNLMKQFCSLMEHQSLVDVLICCGNNSIQAHKFVLAANSPYFREEFEKNPAVEQIVVSSCDFSVVKSILELMYCGYTMVTDESVKYLVALIKLFQMKCLEELFRDHPQNVEDIFIPKPQFLTKKPKYPTHNYSSSQSNNTGGNTVPQSQQSRPVKVTPFSQSTANLANGGSGGGNAQAQKQSKPSAQGRRKLRMQAEQACVKEAQASRMALASLQKEISASPQVNSFLIEDSCTETTVENFIPHSDQQQRNYVQVVNYPIGGSTGFMQPNTQGGGVLHQNSGQVKNKLKNILGPNLPSNVEIMFKDSEGNFVTVTDEVLQSLSTKEGLQYQVIDEDGHIGELQELRDIDRFDKLIENKVGGSTKENISSLTDANTINMEVAADGQLIPSLMEGTSLNLDGKCCVIGADGKEYTLQEAAETWRKKLNIKTEQEHFSPDMFFADIPPATAIPNSEASNNEKVTENFIKNAEIHFEAAEDLSINKENIASKNDCRYEQDMEID